MKEIEKILNIQPTIVEEKKEIIVVDNNEPNINEDFKLVRNNILNVLEKANDAVAKAGLIANDKEDARSFEVLNGLLTTVTDTSLKLLEAHKRKESLGTAEPEQKGGTTITNNTQNNIVFNGTSNDLRKFVQDLKNSKET